MQIEEFGITFKRLKDPSSPLPYNVITKHSRIPVIGGLFQSTSQAAFNADQLQAIQRKYIEYLELAHSMQIDLSVVLPLPSKNDLYNFGNQVASLLPNATRRSLAQAISRTHRTKQALRIVLNFYPDVLELLAVPWELITTALDLEDVVSTQLKHVDQLIERDFLLQNPRISLVRQIHGVGVQSSSSIPQPFPVEALLAHPIGAPAIVDQALIQAMFDPEHYFDGVASLEQLLQRIQAHQPRVVHLVAHGGSAEIEQGLTRYDLLLTQQTGFVRRVGAADLAPILANSAELRLVVLHACYAATQAFNPNGSDSANPLDQQRGVVEGVALGLIRRGIPFVIAFQGEIRQDAAVIFSKTLYQQLERGMPLEFAVTQARLAITAHIPAGVVDWSLPVVYRGAIVHDAQTDYDTLGDRLHRLTESARFRYWFRGNWLALALISLSIATISPFYYPNTSLVNIASSVVSTLNLLSQLGVVIPTIMPIFYRPYFQPRHMEPSTNRFLQIAKFTGAYVGYSVCNAIGIGFYSFSFIIFGELIGHKPFNYLLIVGIVIFNIFGCNFVMRNFTYMQWGLGIYDSAREKIINTIIYIFAATLLLFFLPWAITYTLTDEFNSMLATPILALIMTIATLFVILGIMEHD